MGLTREWDIHCQVSLSGRKPHLWDTERPRHLARHLA
jgi:hypothetical protein